MACAKGRPVGKHVRQRFRSRQHAVRCVQLVEEAPMQTLVRSHRPARIKATRRRGLARSSAAAACTRPCRNLPDRLG